MAMLSTSGTQGGFDIRPCKGSCQDVIVDGWFHEMFGALYRYTWLFLSIGGPFYVGPLIFGNSHMSAHLTGPHVGLRMV